ncbi:hypothetical protein Tco_0963950 [Tanacetum coccineum]
MEIFKQTKLMGASTDSIPPLTYEENFSNGRTYYYQSLLIRDEYKQDKGDRRGVRNIMRLEKEMIDDIGEVTRSISTRCKGYIGVPPPTHIPLRPNLGVLQIGIKSQGYREPDTVMLDSEDSTVTYTAVSSPFEDLPDIGSPGVDGPLVMPEDPYAYVVATFQAPPSPDYVPGPEYPPLPDFVPEPVYPEFMPPEDEVLLAEEQTLPATVSPINDSPGYVLESDPEEDPEEDDDEDPEEDPADYPADGGDDGDDEDESSDDDEDDDVDIEGDEEEEEHPTPADSTVVALLAVDHATSVEETEPFETDESAATPPPHPAYRVTARISIRDEQPTPFWSDTEVARLLAIPTPPPSPLSPWSSPLPQIPSPPLPVSSPVPVISPSPPVIPIHTPPLVTPPSGTPPLLRISLPTSSPPLHLLSTNSRADRPEVTLPPWKRLGIALGLRYEVGESSSAPTARPPGGAPTTDDTELVRRMIEFTTRVRQDTDEIYTRLDEEQFERQLMAGRLNMLYRDRRAHARTARLMEAEARMSQEAWGRSMDASDLARAEVMSLHTQVVAQQMTEFERQQGPAKGPTQPDAPEEAGSSS